MCGGTTIAQYVQCSFHFEKEKNGMAFFLFFLPLSLHLNVIQLRVLLLIGSVCAWLCACMIICCDVLTGDFSMSHFISCFSPFCNTILSQAQSVIAFLLKIVMIPSNNNKKKAAQTLPNSLSAESAEKNNFSLAFASFVHRDENFVYFFLGKMMLLNEVYQA